ncbi:MAG: SurA N-terminal domain-containing protein [Alphaproteobacteria bacterium]
MLSTLRKNSQSPIYKALLWVLIFSFAAFGLGGVASFVNNNAMSVDGKSYSTQNLANDAYREIQYQQQEEIALTSADIEAIVNNVASQKAFEMSLNNEATSKGFSATDQEVRDSVRGNRQFWVNGQFDQGRYELYLSQNRIQEEQYLKSVRKSLSVNQLVNAASAGAEVPNVYLAAIENQMAKLARNISVRYIPITSEDIKEDVIVSDDKIATYYQNNEEEFRLPEYRNVEIFSLSADDYATKNPDGNFSQDLSALVDSIDDDTGAGVNFTDIATNRGGKVETVTIDAQGYGQDGILKNIGGEQVISLINNAAIGIATSAILVADTNTQNSALYAIYVNDVIPSRIASLDEVKDDIQLKLQDEAKNETLQAFAQNLVNDAKANGGIEALSAELSGSVQIKENMTSSALAASLAPFSSADALADLLLGNVGDIQALHIGGRWFIMETTAFHDVSQNTLADAIAMQKQVFDSSYAISIANSFTSDIRSIHKVKIKPSSLVTITNSLAAEAQ